jgi:uncharacterized protein (TIGR03435 family)
MAQGKGSNQPVRRAVRAEPGFSSSEVHITPTTMKAGSTSMETGGDRWSARGYDLKALISQIYDIDARRIDFANDGTADVRYDVTLTLPREVDEDAMRKMIESAVQRRFGLTIAPENRSMNVYVLTAPNGPGAALHRHGTAAGEMPTPVAAGSVGVANNSASESESESESDDAGQITYFGKDCSGVSSGGGIEASAGTIAEFRRTLEPDLDRLLVDETRLTGSYDFKIGNYSNQQELFKLLLEQLGIVVTPTQRRVTMLTVRPAQLTRAAM